MVYKFGDIAYNITEKRSPKPEDSQNYIGLEHLDSGSLYVNRYGIDVELKGDKLVMHKGDILLGKRNAYLRRAAIAPHDGLFSAHGMILRPKEVILSEFFPFFVASDKFFDDVIRISVGGLSPTVNWKDLKELEFDLPSLAEQKVLAEKLWAAYEVKQSYLKMIAATEEMVKAQFVDMVGSVTTNKSLCDICRPKQWPTIQTKDFTKEGYLVYGANGVIGHYLDYNHENPTILMACRGASCGAINVSEPKSYITGNAMCLDDLSDEVCFEFLVHYLSYYNYRGIITGGAQPQITYTSLQKVSVPIPSKEIQESFVTFANQADASISELRKSVDAIDKVIKSLINENL